MALTRSCAFCSIWYETTDNCYVTEWDIIDGNCTSGELAPRGKYAYLFSCFELKLIKEPTLYLDTSVLPYCGKIAETYTQGPGKTVYNTECNIIPEFVGETADHTKMYKPEVDLTLTCKTTEGEAVLDNTYVLPGIHSLAGVLQVKHLSSNWYKTLSNCYVPEAEIEPVGK